MFEGNGLAQYMVLIQYWLKEEPDAGLDEFSDQAARAMWMEERYFTNIGKALGGKK
ncbi:MAG: hypothetical protein ABIK15_07315 [Pseudomonadota bacterium]